MSLKNAALLAFVSTLLLTVVLAIDFFRMLTGVLSGFIPAMTLLRSLVYLFASLCVTILFWVLGKQNR